MVVKKKTKRAIEYILIIIFLAIIIFATYKIVIWTKENKKSKEEKEEIQNYVIVENIEPITQTLEGTTEEIEQEETTTYKVDFEALKNKNPDTVGWLKVNNTSIAYPVVRGDSSNYYVNHSFNKSENSAGWIFTDPRDLLDGSDKNIVIYGHNRRDRSMFGSLSDVLKKEWYSNESNLKIRFITENEDSIYQIFSTYTIDAAEDYIEIYFDTAEEFDSYINRCIQRSSRDFGIEVTSSDKILTLCTCANDNNYRVIVHAKKI